MVSDGRYFSYDEVPYPDLCYIQTHPDRLGTLGRLLGMTPAPVEKCRVLEIGCAGGGNLLPMAAGLPDSTFVGIDYSAVQIEAAQAVLNNVTLPNVTFRQMDIMEITPEFGTFDYIIAHGIYSWFPRKYRISCWASVSKILRLKALPM
jgi:tRNA G46 methylase TrmB